MVQFNTNQFNFKFFMIRRDKAHLWKH